MTPIALATAILCLLFAAWLRGAGTAITWVPRADALRDVSEDVSGAATVAELLEQRETIAPGVGVVASAFMVVGAAMATAVLVGPMGSGWAAVGVAAGIGVVSFLIADLIPRRLGRLNPSGLSYASHGVLRWAVRVGDWANGLIPDVETGDDDDDDDGDGDDEHERDLIDSVLEFTETLVREVMTPRPDMVTIPVNGSIEELIEVATEAGYSRVPVTSDRDVVGMVIVKDLLPMLTDTTDRPDTVAEVMRTAEFVPETKLAASLLAEMQEHRTHQVIVVDEYGDVTGLVTIEDLLEELVGEIADETDLEEELIVESGDGWWVDARLPVDVLYKATGLDDHETDGDTVGGLVLGLAERVPEEGETFTLEHLMLTVNRMQGRRVAEVTVVLTDPVDAQ